MYSDDSDAVVDSRMISFIMFMMVIDAFPVLVRGTGQSVLVTCYLSPPPPLTCKSSSSPALHPALFVGLHCVQFM